MHILKIHKLLSSDNEGDRNIGIQLFLEKNKYWYILLDIIGSLIATGLIIPLILSVWAFFQDWKESKGVEFMSYKAMLLVTRYHYIEGGDITGNDDFTHMVISPFTVLIGMIRLYRNPPE